MDQILADSDVAIIQAPNNLIVGNRQDFKTYLRKVAEDRHTLINMGVCSYIDSSGIGMLLSYGREIRRGRKNLGFFGLNSDFWTLMEMTRVNREIYLTRSRAADKDVIRDLRAFQPIEFKGQPGDDQEDEFPPLKLV